MGLPFEHGYEVIAEMIKRRDEERNEEFIRSVFFFANPFGLCQAYDSYEDFKTSLNLRTTEHKEDNPDEILDGVKNILDAFQGGV